MYAALLAVALGAGAAEPARPGMTQGNDQAQDLLAPGAVPPPDALACSRGEALLLLRLALVARWRDQAKALAEIGSHRLDGFDPDPPLSSPFRIELVVNQGWDAEQRRSRCTANLAYSVPATLDQPRRAAPVEGAVAIDYEVGTASDGRLSVVLGPVIF